MKLASSRENISRLSNLDELHYRIRIDSMSDINNSEPAKFPRGFSYKPVIEAMVVSLLEEEKNQGDTELNTKDFGLLYHCLIHRRYTDTVCIRHCAFRVREYVGNREEVRKRDGVNTGGQDFRH